LAQKERTFGPTIFFKRNNNKSPQASPFRPREYMDGYGDGI